MNRYPSSNGLMTILLGLLLGGSAWMGGAPGWMGQVFLVGCAALLLAIRLVRGAGYGDGSDGWRDPLLWLGLGLMALLMLQWINSGRWLYFNPVTDGWMHAAPRFTWLPWSFNRAEAAEMLVWFFPAWVLILTFRWRTWRRTQINRILWFLALNGLALALVGLAQAVSGTDAIYWRFPRRAPFFAGFDYRNHAAAYFVLMLGLAVGMFVRELWRILRHGTSTSKVRVFAAGAASVGLLIAVIASNSRTGMLTGALTLVAAGLALGVYLHRSARHSHRALTTLVTAGLTLSIVMVWIVLAINRQGWRSESLIPNPVAELQLREWQVKAAMRMWRENPWFGVGGWGYAHLLPLAEPSATSRIGAANVHNDAVQFLVEFGVVGAGLMVAALVLLWGRYLRRVRALNGRTNLALAVGAAAGLLMVMIHSLYDLPFRNPAILLTWSALICAIPAMIRPVTDPRRLSLRTFNIENRSERKQM